MSTQAPKVIREMWDEEERARENQQKRLKIEKLLIKVIKMLQEATFKSADIDSNDNNPPYQLRAEAAMANAVESAVEAKRHWLKDIRRHADDE